MKTNNQSPRVGSPLLAAPLLALSAFAMAAGPVAPVVPNAGSILQQIAPPAPPTPSLTESGLKIERQDGERIPPGKPFVVRTLSITGNSLFATATLHALVADSEGKSLTLEQLNELAARITDFYQRHGYPLARAIIPAQTIADGVVRIEVVEASYGKIKLQNNSRVDDRLLEATLAGLQPGRVVEQAELDRALLLLADIPGMQVTGTLQPGEAVGTSDLLVQSLPGPLLGGNVTVNNHGSRYTGNARISGTVNVINPLRRGDVLTLYGLSSGSELTNYARLAYELLLNGQGTRLGGAYSALRYVLGGSLSSLDGHGRAETGSVWVKQPFVRGRKLNLYGQLEYDDVRLRDRYDVSAIRIDRHLRNWTASLAGDLRDDFVAGSVASWSLGYTAGDVSFDDSSARSVDAAGAATQGGFSKWTASFARLQALTPRDGLYLALSGQWANTNLDSSQKMLVGGPYAVRAYAVGAVSGDRGHLGTVEYRRDLGTAGEGQWEGVLFIDSAHVTVNRKPWVAGANGATLSGVGLGLNWAGPSQWSAKLYVAARIGSPPDLVGDTSSVRAWAQIGKSF